MVGVRAEGGFVAPAPVAAVEAWAVSEGDLEEFPQAAEGVEEAVAPAIAEAQDLLKRVQTLTPETTATAEEWPPLSASEARIMESLLGATPGSTR